MKMFTAIIEKCPDTGLYVGYVPNFQAPTRRERHWTNSTNNLREVIEMVLEDGEAEPEAEFVGTQMIVVA